MLFRSVYAVGDGISFLSYYEVLLGRPEYLVRFFRSLGMCLLIAAGQTLISCLAGTAFAKYRFIGDRFWFAVFVLFMILPIQVTLLPNYILLEMLGFLNSWKALIIPAVFSPFGTVWLTFVPTHMPASFSQAGIRHIQPRSPEEALPRCLLRPQKFSGNSDSGYCCS